MRVLKHHISFIILLTFLAGCSKFTRIQKKGTFEEKYAAAVAYYEEEDYFRAGTLFNDIFPFSIGTPQATDIHLKSAYCHYYEGSLYLAAEDFNSFIRKYPRNPKVEEAMFMYSKSLYGMSGAHNLDQTETIRAINAIQSYLNAYPQTTRKEECNEKIAILEKKLELKAYENATLQLKIGHYRAAVIAFERFETQFPASNYIEELDFLKVKAQYLFAKNSIEKLVKDGKTYYLKKERLEQAIVFYEQFIDEYPTSEFIKDAQNIYNSIQSSLNTLTNS